MPQTPIATSGIETAGRMEGGDLRGKVLKVASELFARDGYGSVSMRRIGAQAGCSAMALYRYFASKEDLLISICEETFLQLSQSREIAAKRQPTALKRLRAALRAFIRFGMEHPNHYKLAFITDLPPGPLATRGAAIAERGLGEVRELVRDCAAEKNLNIDVDLTVQVLRVACQGLISAAVVQPSGLKVNNALVDRVIRMLTRDFE